MGVATRAGGVLFVTCRDTCVRACRQYSQLSVIRRRRQTCLNLSVLARVLFSRLAGGYSRVSDLLSFESETCRASVVWETRG